MGKKHKKNRNKNKHHHQKQHSSDTNVATEDVKVEEGNIVDNVAKSVEHHVSSGDTHSEKSDEEQTFSPKSMSGIVTGAIIAIIVILLIIFIPGNKDKEQQDVVDVEESVEEVVADELDSLDSRTLSMRPVEDGEFNYSFQDIIWEFEAEDEAGVGVPVTRVNWKFDQFTRFRDGAPVTFGNPYKMGVIQGECSEVSSLDYNTDQESGIPLKFASCELAGGEGTTDYAVFQEERNIVVKNRTYESSNQSPRFAEVFTIDMAEVVQ